MILDVNAYIGNWPYWPLRGNDIASILRKMDKYGIERAFLSSLKGVFADPKEGNRIVQSLAARHPDRFWPAFTYSPYASRHESFRQDLEGAEIRIVKLFPLNHSYDPLEEPFIASLLDHCSEKRIPVMIPHRLMMTWRLPTFDIKKIARLAEVHPETTFILGSVNYLFELQAALDALRRRPNLYLDTSAMMAFREIETVVSIVGAGRLIHGSCNPLQNPAIGPLKINSAEISDDEKEDIFSRNLMRLIKPD